MTELLEILKYILPSLIVFLTAFLILRSYLRNEDKKRNAEINMANKDTVLPLRLQAFERLIIFLERISADSLVMRFRNTRLTVAQMQNELLNNIRSEYEHNLAQQIYISPGAWDIVKSARGEVVRLINTSAAELKPDDKGINLSKRILENAMKIQDPSTQGAIQYLKKEARELF